MATVELDADFLALPLEGVRSAALDRAQALGCEHAEVRVERIRSQVVRLRDGQPRDLRRRPRARRGASGRPRRVVRVRGDRRARRRRRRRPRRGGRRNGEGDRACLPRACRAGRRAGARRGGLDLVLRDRPHRGARRREGGAARGLERPPAAVAGRGPRDCLRARRRRGQALRRSRRHGHHPAPGAGPPGGRGGRGRRRGRRLRDDADVWRRRPAGAGSTSSATGWDWDDELARIPDYLAEKLHAPSVAPGAYDLVIDPTNLWLTIHESIGHATELDRALGYEAAYAGTSFATFDKLGNAPLRLGGHERHRGPHTWSTAWRRSATTTRESRRRRSTSSATACSSATSSTGESRQLLGLGRSNGCAFADSPLHTPIQRMANVSLRPAPGDGPTTEELISGVDHGIYVVGDKSWSIDMQRYNFQFTGQRFFRIEKGKLAGQVRDLAYQARTTDFWGAMEAVGWRVDLPARRGVQLREGPARPGGAGQPRLPVGPVPRINVLNTRAESGR